MQENPATMRFSGVREDFSRVKMLQSRNNDFCVMSTESNLGEFTPKKPCNIKG